MSNPTALPRTFAVRCFTCEFDVELNVDAGEVDDLGGVAVPTSALPGHHGAPAVLCPRCTGLVERLRGGGTVDGEVSLYTLREAVALAERAAKERGEYPEETLERHVEALYQGMDSAREEDAARWRRRRGGSP